MYNIDFGVVGKRIAHRRKELKLTQWEVEEIADITQKHLSNLERASSGLSIDVLMRLCEALQTTPNYLLMGSTGYTNPEADEIESRVERMSPKQRELALSLMDWVLTQKL